MGYYREIINLQFHNDYLLSFALSYQFGKPWPAFKIMAFKIQANLSQPSNYIMWHIEHASQLQTNTTNYAAKQCKI